MCVRISRDFICHLIVISIRLSPTTHWRCRANTRMRPMTDVTTALVEHYQKTYELTYKLWQQRNRTFLLLLAVIAAATFLSFRTPVGDTLLASWIAKSAGMTDEAQIDKMRKSFP